MRPTNLLLNDQQRCFITHCFHRRRRAPSVSPLCSTGHHGLEVVSTLPRWYYLDDGDNDFFCHVNHSSRVPCAIVHRPTGSHLVSPLVRQCFLRSTDVVRCFFMMMIKMPLQFYSYGNADFVDGMNQEVFTKSPRVCQRIFVCVIFFVSFKSLVFVFHWNALCQFNCTTHIFI